MRKLAKRINYSPPMIYTFFKDKEELLRSLSNLGAGRFATVVENMETWANLAPVARMTALMHKFFDECLGNPRAYLNSFFSELPGSPPYLLRVTEENLANPSFALFLGIIAEGNAEGSMHVADSVAAVQACWAASHGLLLALLSMPKSEEKRRGELIETMVSMLIAGLTAGPGIFNCEVTEEL